MTTSASAPPRVATVADGFSGSYAAEDVTFLLTRADVAVTDVQEKERLIQSGTRHYSELLAPETPPHPDYITLFNAVMADTLDRFAGDIAALACRLVEEVQQSGAPILISLVRAGTPIGVLLRRALVDLGVRVPHYAVSIIRDRGIDGVALDAIRAAEGERPLVFVDGWTGKGAIACELRSAIAAYNADRGTRIDPSLVVVSDPAGQARLAARGDDCLIPNAILNAPISGLVSRSVLNDRLVGPGQFHACAFYEDWRPIDRSTWFVDTVATAVRAMLPAATPAHWSEADRAGRRAQTRRFIDDLMACTGVQDRNRIKPGIGEATRAVMRRLPDRVIIQDPDAGDIRHLTWLAWERGVAVDIDPMLPPPWHAVAVIKSLGRG